MANISDYMDDFINKISSALTKDKSKQEWQTQDIWWNFSKLVVSVNEFEDILTGKKSGDVSDQAIKVANLAIIVAVLNKISKKKLKDVNITT